MLASLRRPLIAIGLIAVLNVPSMGQEAPRVRVLSFNLNHGEGADSRVDFNRLTAAIRSAEPDVVALQEVDRGMARTGRVDQARLIAGRLKMGHAFGGNLEFLGGEHGNAILSRWPIAAQANHPLPSSGGEPRGALDVTIEPDDQPPFVLICTQLDHRRDDRDRLAAASWLATDLDTAGMPAILAADLNADVDSTVFDRIATSWTTTADTPMPTVPASAPRTQYDALFVRPQSTWRVVEVRVIDAPAASDHRPILAVLERISGRPATPVAPERPGPASDPEPDLIADDLDTIRLDRFLGGPRLHGAVGHGELRAVPGACHRPAAHHAAGQRAATMGATVVEGDIARIGPRQHDPPVAGEANQLHLIDLQLIGLRHRDRRPAFGSTATSDHLPAWA